MLSKEHGWELAGCLTESMDELVAVFPSLCTNSQLVLFSVLLAVLFIDADSKSVRSVTLS